MTLSTRPESSVRVGIIMGSDSDWSVMEHASLVLNEFNVSHEVEIVSAHRTPEKLYQYAREARSRGIKVIVAGAGGSAHLPGMVAALTTLPVVGVPVSLATLDGLDSLLSIVQMPAGVPVATVSIGGARNAGILAVRILATHDSELSGRLDEFASALESSVHEKNARLHESFVGSRTDFQK